MHTQSDVWGKNKLDFLITLNATKIMTSDM